MGGEDVLLLSRWALSLFSHGVSSWWQVLLASLRCIKRIKQKKIVIQGNNNHGGKSE